MLEGDRRFDLVVRWKPQYRAEPRCDPANPRHRCPAAATSRSARSPISAPPRVPHSSIAKVCERYVPVRFAVRGRDLQSARRRRQADGRARGQAARGCASGMGRRIWRTAAGQSPPDDRGAVRAAADRRRALRRDHLADRYLHHHGADSGRLPGRHPRPVSDRDAVQRLGRGRLHLDLRHRRDGRDPAELLHPPAVAGGPSVSSNRSSWAPIGGCARR